MIVLPDDVSEGSREKVDRVRARVKRIHPGFPRILRTPYTTASGGHMHDILRERLWRNLEALPEDRLYQVLDYIEFLNSKYARDAARPPASSFQRFGEKLEDHMRMNGVGFSAIRGTLQVMGTADRVVADFAEIGRSLLKEVETGLKAAGESTTDRSPRLEKGATATRPEETPPPGDSG
jgi:hypothetical protein